MNSLITKLKSLIFRPAVFILLLALGISYLLIGNKSKSMPAKALEQTWQVKALPLVVGNYQPQATLHGQVISFNKATIRSAIEAEVEAVLIKDGQKVARNQLLARLEKAEFELILKQRQADVDKLKALIATEEIQNQIDKETALQDEKLIALSQKMRQRHSTLKQRNLSSQAQVDDAEKTYISHLISLKKTQLKLKNHQFKIRALTADLQKALTQLQKAKIDLADTDIAAPFDAVITDVMIAKGDRLTRNAPIAALYRLDALELKVQLTERIRAAFSKALSEKQPITAQIDNGTTLTLVRIDSAIEAGSSNVDAFFEIDKKAAANLPLGMIKSVTIFMPAISDSYLVPQSAVYHGDTIYLVNEQRLQSVKVKRFGKAKKGNQYYYVIKPLQGILKNRQVITTKLPFIRSGLKVDVVQ